MTELPNEELAQAIELGQLNKIAYDMYGKDPVTPKFPGFKDYEFVAWVQMRDFDVHSLESPYCFYGFIVRKAAEANSYVLVIRGTANAEELYDDFKAASSISSEHGKTAKGFDLIFETMRVVGSDGKSISKFWAKDFPAQVKATIDKHAASAATQGASTQKSITVTGHSLGSALATLYVAKVSGDGDKELEVKLLCTFASPLVGDATFANWFDGLRIPSWRIVNFMDQVTRVPPTFLGFRHINQEYRYTSGNDTINSINCYHAIDTYLHLLDPENFDLGGCQYIGPPIG